MSNCGGKNMTRTLQIINYQKFFLVNDSKGFSRLLKHCQMNCHKIVNRISTTNSVNNVLKITQHFIAHLANAETMEGKVAG